MRFEDLKQVACGEWPNLYTIKKGSRLVQICAPELQQFSPVDDNTFILDGSVTLNEAYQLLSIEIPIS